MERYYTTKEQSKELLKLGLNPETADMCFEYQKAHWPDEPAYLDWPQCYKKHDKQDIPCWSLVALLNLIPNFELIAHDIANGRFRNYYIDSGFHQTEFKTSLIDSAFDMVVYLLKCEKQFGKDGTYMKTRNIVSNENEPNN